MSDSTADFKKVLSCLNDGHVRYVVIGGLAGIFHGVARATYDIDVCHARDRKNLEAIAAVLKTLGAKLRVRDGALPFLADWKTLEMGLNFTLRTNSGDLDLLGEVAGVGDYEACFAESTAGEIAGNDVQILSLPKLILAKRAAGRTKDIDDLRTLEALQTMHDKNPESEPPTA